MEALSALTLITSVIALLVSWRQAVKTRKLKKITQKLTANAQDWSMSDSIDEAITGILQVQLEHPEFRSENIAIFKIGVTRSVTRSCDDDGSWSSNHPSFPLIFVSRRDGADVARGLGGSPA